jgi:hypothetical protein
MQLLLQGAYLHFFPDLRHYVERRLGYALGRCRIPVKRATVSLKNLKAKQRGAEWCCAIRIKLHGRRILAVQATCAMPSGAIDLAAERLGKPIARAGRGRKRAYPRDAPPASAAQPQWGGRTVNRVPRAIRRQARR